MDRIKRTGSFRMRVSVEERELWKAMARRDGKPLAQLIREGLALHRLNGMACGAARLEGFGSIELPQPPGPLSDSLLSSTARSTIAH